MNPLTITGEQFAQKYLGGEKMDSVKSGIAKVASQNKWTAHEIERVVESANRNILVNMSKNASKKVVDPHFTFPTIKTAEIIGMLSNPPAPMAMARAPMQDVPKMIIAPTTSMMPSMAGAVDPEQFIEGGAPSKEVALMALRLLRDRVAEKKSKYCQMEMQLNEAVEKFEKMASQELIGGTPIEVFAHCGAADVTAKVAKKLVDHNIKIAHMSKNASFEIEKTHPIYMHAEKIESLRVKTELLKCQYNIAESGLTSKTAAFKNQWVV
jgi:hypothetical protein